MSRALSVDALLKKKFSTLDLSEDFADAFGHPERTGVWFIWGNPGNGKTSFTLQLCREFARFGRVAFNSREEGYSLPIQDAFERLDIGQEQRRRIVLINEPIKEMAERIRKHKSPHFYVVDSIQYADMNFSDFLKFKAEASKKLVVFTSQADGTRPAGRTAARVMFDASLKIWVEGFRAFSKGRYIGPIGHFNIWPEAAERHWGATPALHEGR